MAKILRDFRFFTIFQYDLEEDYLRDMASKGYHFTSVIFPGIYQFEVGEPENVVYRLDYPGESYKKDPEYQEMLGKTVGSTLPAMRNLPITAKRGKLIIRNSFQIASPGWLI